MEGPPRPAARAPTNPTAQQKGHARVYYSFRRRYSKERGQHGRAAMEAWRRSRVQPTAIRERDRARSAKERRMRAWHGPALCYDLALSPFAPTPPLMAICVNSEIVL